MIKQLLFIHPLGQAFAFLFGVINIVTGFASKKVNLALHINCGALYYIIALMGTGMGVVAVKVARHNDVALSMGLHNVNAMVMIVFFAVGATTGAMMAMNKQKIASLKKYHGLANLISLVLFVCQFFSGIMVIMK
ncbi:MAG: hypothetical protein GY868_21110, partial [Deltaproteobacteria bacterium]|nr:hypothetical protein [Deltaproteobacteria bacterium]